jgi:hypothetical protein
MSVQGKTKEEIIRERRKQKILGGANDRLGIITGTHPVANKQGMCCLKLHAPIFVIFQYSFHF